MKYFAYRVRELSMDCEQEPTSPPQKRGVRVVTACRPMRGRLAAFLPLGGTFRLGADTAALALPQEAPAPSSPLPAARVPFRAFRGSGRTTQSCRDEADSPGMVLRHLEGLTRWFRIGKDL